MTKTQKKTAKIDKNINLAQSKTNRNYWFPLTYLVEEEEQFMGDIARPIRKAGSESEREMQIFLKQNGTAKTKHWTEIWKRNSNEDRGVDSRL